MKSVGEKHGFHWYKEISHEYDMVGIHLECPALAIAAYQDKRTGQWDNFIILKLETHHGFLCYRKQVKLGSFDTIEEAITQCQLTLIAIVNEKMPAMSDNESLEKR